MKDAVGPLANFFASGLLALGDRLGPILWQLPATMRFDPERVDAFLEMLPKTTRAMGSLAAEHDDRVPAPLIKASTNRRVRHALEVRHQSFYVPEMVDLARKHNVAIVLSDSPDWPLLEEITADFIYARLHGSTRMYASRYTDDELNWWATRIRKWAAGGQAGDAVRVIKRAPPRKKSRDVYVYFDNDQQTHAPRDAIRLAKRVESPA